MFTVAALAAIGGAIGSAWLMLFSPAKGHSHWGIALRLFVSISVAVVNTRLAIDLINRTGWIRIDVTDTEYIIVVGAWLGFFSHSLIGVLDRTRSRLARKDIFELLTVLRQRSFSSKDK